MKTNQYRNHKQWYTLLFLTIACDFVYLALQGYWNHHGFLSSLNDSGCFDQVIWNYTQDSSFTNTSQFKEPSHWFGLHFQPILYFFVPLYTILPSINWLIVTQAFCLTITAYPIFLAAFHITKDYKTSYIWVLVYLLNPFVLSASFWDFHPNSIATPLMAIGMLAVLKKMPRTLLTTCLLLLLIKEHYGLTVSAFAFLYWLKHRNTAFSLALKKKKGTNLFSPKTIC